jgi:ABC-type sugar transport system substrate-binding protein
VDYQNAGNDARLQHQQAREVLARGAKVLVVDVVDSRNSAGIVAAARERNVPVIS